MTATSESSAHVATQTWSSEQSRPGRSGSDAQDALDDVGEGDDSDDFHTFDFGYTLRGPTLGGFLPMSVVAPGILVLEEIQVLPREGPFPLRPLARARAR